MRLRRLTQDEYVDGVLRGNRTILGRAITLIESDLEQDAELAAGVVEGLLPHSGKSRRVGVTGPPGAGKSTLLDRLGMHIIREHNERVAVLTIDPSSPISSGSILGDKTRMEQLAREEMAFVRPTPARSHLGGVGRRTREAILLCEAAGYPNVFVETVGVGQSEIAVRSMVDFVLLVLAPGAGDELQGIKRGIIETIDAIAVNKADSGNEQMAELARAEYAAALHLQPQPAQGWTRRVQTCSCITGAGIADLWSLVLQHRRCVQASGGFARHRRAQTNEWLSEEIASQVQRLLRKDPMWTELLDDLEQGRTSPIEAARRIVTRLRS